MLLYIYRHQISLCIELGIIYTRVASCLDIGNRSAVGDIIELSASMPQKARKDVGSGSENHLVLTN